MESLKILKKVFISVRLKVVRLIFFSPFIHKSNKHLLDVHSNSKTGKVVMQDYNKGRKIIVYVNVSL